MSILALCRAQRCSLLLVKFDNVLLNADARPCFLSCSSQCALPEVSAGGSLELSVQPGLCVQVETHADPAAVGSQGAPRVFMWRWSSWWRFRALLPIFRSHLTCAD